MSKLEKASSQKAKSAVSDAESCPESSVAFTINVDTLSSNGWYIDFGATSHMTNDRNFFTEFSETKPVKVTVANGQYMMSEEVGNGYLHCQTLDDVKRILVKNVLYVPALETNLMSVKRLTKQGNVVTFEGNNCIISKDNRPYAKGKITNDLYQLVCEKTNSVKHEFHQKCVHMWHRRLGHRDPEAVLKLNREKLPKKKQTPSSSSRSPK